MAYRRGMRPPAAQPKRIGFWLIMGAVILLAGYLAMSRAGAHSAAEWIQRGGYKNALGELCCGERDCAEIPDSDIGIEPGGYRVKSIKELVPYDEATPSPNGKYWRCYWGGKRKCFFAPPPAT